MSVGGVIAVRSAAARREAGVRKWVRRRLGSVDHERRVVACATVLFDLLRPLHDLPRRELRLLRLAALVHDIGRSIDDDGHHEHGARLVSDRLPVPMAGRMRRRLKYLTQYHRGSVPAVGEDEILRAGDRRSATCLLLAILRVADMLDCRQLPSPRLQISVKKEGSRRTRLKIAVWSTVGSAVARRAFDRPKKWRLLEEMLDVRVELELKSGT